MAGLIRVLIVDDDPLARSALTTIVNRGPNMHVVGEATDGGEVPTVVDQYRPHVVLMDIRMSHVDGLTATEQLRSRPSPPEIVVLTTFHADEYVLRALRAGASGFLLKDTTAADIQTAIARVAAGEPILSPTVTRQLITHLSRTGIDTRHKHAHDQLARLSPREHEVAIAVGQGHSNAEISNRLIMSLATVKQHVSSILTKLDLNNRTQIALLAHDAGIT